VFLATLVTATAALALIYVVAGLTLSH
jgi:hypothetical protein